MGIPVVPLVENLSNPDQHRWGWPWNFLGPTTAKMPFWEVTIFLILKMVSGINLYNLS